MKLVRKTEDLAELVEQLGYNDPSFKQLLFNNGAAASSLIDFFDDNPGALDVIVNWIEENHKDNFTDTDYAEQEDEEIADDEDAKDQP